MIKKATFKEDNEEILKLKNQVEIRNKIEQSSYYMLSALKH